MNTYTVKLTIADKSASPWESEELAARIKEYLIWHDIIGEATYCKLISVEAEVMEGEIA